MGNSNSQNQQIPGHQWAHSYPRQRHLQPQVKVLPEQIPPLRLRTTDNGAILQNGGTISARKHSFGPEGRVYRPRSSSAHRPPNLDEINLHKTRFGSEPDLRFHLKESRDQFSDNAVRQRISRSRKKYKAPPAPHSANNNGMESSSSEINGWESSSKDCSSGPGRKARLFKTRAESSKKNAMAVHKLELMDSEVTRSSEALHVTKPRFKDEKSEQNSNIDKDKMEKKGLKRSASHEVISTRKSLATPEFHAELIEAAQKMRSLAAYKNKISPTLKKKNLSKSNIERSKENTPSNRSGNINSNEIKSNTKTIQVFGQEDLSSKSNRIELRSEFENLSKVTVLHGKNKQDRDVPSKKFYFGMEENNNEVKIVNNSESTNNVDKTNAAHRMTAVEKSKNLVNLYKSVSDTAPDWEETVDKFAANFHKSQVTLTNGNTTSCSSSFVSDPDEDVVGGIALQLRPTLPKKQLEIPRFSPTAAWRLLSSIDLVSSQAFFSGENDDGPLLLEDRIHPPGPQQGLRSSHDKSGDSGISGDASPGGCHESSSELMTPAKTVAAQKNVLVAWTPQQDLEEESSSDDLESPLNSSKTIGSRIPGAKFSPRGQLFLSRDQSFSLSASREDPMCLYTESFDSKERSMSDLTPRLNSLKKLKTALVVSKRAEGLEDNPHSQNDNWVLSKSVPSSLNNSHLAVTRSMSNPSSPEQDDEINQSSLKYPSYSYLARGGRMMYLPEYHSRISPDVCGKKPKTTMMNSFLSKSCENIMETEMRQLRRSRSPSPARRLPADNCSTNQKKKKFTFQSTVRLIENRRLAEKLSREAELKENQRLSEVEAMRKVEEEFQKKRAREKANIRQQLRLFSLEEKNYNSLPPCEWEDNAGDVEVGPCSLPPRANYSNKKSNVQSKKHSGSNEINKLASSTQVLSEYREPTRDYRDYRQSRCPELQELPIEPGKRSVVEHPRMVYDMPKNTPVYVSAPVNSFVQSHGREEIRSSSSDNYRKDFAQGALAAGGRSLTSSDSELSQSHPRSGSCQGLTPRRYNAIRRSRSASSESLSPSNSPQRYRNGSSESLPRSRSISPAKNFTDGMSGSESPERKNMREKPLQHFISTKNLSVSLERKLSNPNDYRTTIKTNENTLNRNSEKQEPFDRRKTNSLVRLGLPSLQPFEKTEKSFRPINFSPVINKLAQTVN